MSNGNNNGHHRNGTGNGLVHATGNGHKPDAAIVTEHELLWDGLSPVVTQALGPATRPGPRLATQGPRRAHLRLPRRARRNRPGKPDIFGYVAVGAYDIVVGDVTLRRDRDGRYSRRAR